MRRLLAGILLVSACSLGPRAKRFAPARDPQGALAKVTRGRATFNAELLAITDSALLVLDTDGTRIVVAPYDAITTVSFVELPSGYLVRRGQPPTGKAREQLRLWSRYPTGVNAGLLQRLLSAYGQDSVAVLASCAARGC